MSTDADLSGGSAAPPEADGQRPSLASALGRVQTLVSALEADGVRVSEVDPAIAPEHLRDGHVTVTLTLGLPLDERAALPSSEDVEILDSSEGMPATSADGGTAVTSTAPAPATPDGPTVAAVRPAPRPLDADAEPAVRPVETGPDRDAETWYCSVCGLGPRDYHGIETHRWDEDRCDGADIVAEKPTDTISALDDEAWYCQGCGRGPSTRRSAAIHASRAHEDAAVGLEEPALAPEPRDVTETPIPAIRRVDDEPDASDPDVEALPGGHDPEALAAAAAEYPTLGDVAQALDITSGEARTALVHAGHYGEIKEGGPTGAVTEGNR